MSIADFVYIVAGDSEGRDELRDEIATRGHWSVRSFADERDWLDAAPDLDPGCVLLDLRQPAHGLAVLERTNATAPVHVTVLLGAPCDTASTVSAMKAGAVDVVELPIHWECLAGTIEAAFHELGERTERQLRRAQAQALIARLSPREHDVMLALIEGLSNKLIAYRLNLSPRTVEVHRASLMAKMKMTNLVDLLRCAIAAGIVEE